METSKKTGAVAALAAALLLPIITASPAIAAPSDDPGHIYVYVNKTPTGESIGNAAKFAAERCNRSMAEMVRLARDVDGSGETEPLHVCRTGNAAPVDIFFSDVLL
jgi:hypothetical protein